ncbi:tyrosine-type recombinase/integrase [Aurantibacter sp.]|uniref:tyrosine-type recombinase/integrase n=1 Tax=Aurantibacter sp. TaxID=2807103 RepID=UPI0035C7DCF3
MATYQLLLRDSKPKKDGTFPLIFKIYLGNKSKIITLPFSCEKREWDAKNKRLRKNHFNYKDINEKLGKLTTRLQNAIDDLEIQEIDYDLNDIYNAFKEESKANRVKEISVSEFLQKRIKELNAEGRYGSERTLKDTCNSLSRYLMTAKEISEIEVNKKLKTSKAFANLKFKDVTPAFLEDYEHYLRKRGGTDGGIGVKMREIRVNFNKAITHGYAKVSHYPFNIYKVAKLKSKSRKIAIDKEEFESFKSFNIKEHIEYKITYKMFLFSYYAGGMNFKDMTYLRWENISDGRLVYKRSKINGNFNFKLRKEATDILNYFKNNMLTENEDYIFHVINRYNLTYKQIHYRYKKCLRKFNKDLKFIAESVGIEKNLTSYVARHSFATHLKFNKVQESVISQLMGHSSESVTKAYLQDFGSDVLDDAMSKLN